jgi:hypothetical protein
MLNCRAVFINGPLNSGQTAISRLLAQQIPNAALMDGETLVAKEELNHSQWLVATVMTGTLRACELAHEGKLPILTFPLRDSDWKVVLKLCDHAGVTPVCITLNPGLENALTTSNGPELTEADKHRIREMYLEGYHQRSFSSMILENASESAEQCCHKIRSYLDRIGS